MMLSNNLVPGQIVKSKSGHDKGCVFFVVDVLDNFVMIADGKHRKLENPKKKKVKHLQPYNKINTTVAEKLLSGARIENIELQRELEKSGVLALAMANQEERN